ncbi:MAG TPA: hypothetical protein VFE13_05815, partial [Caulobacteraceae bacterium]|nr:hypothetical protein [Caulobacteraceae bacterium]
SRGNGATSTLTNNGLFEKTGGTGTSVVAAKFVNNGTITVTSGTLEFLAGTFTNNGTINGNLTTDGSGNIFITAAAGAVKPASAGVHAMTQAAAGFAAGRAGTPTASGPHRSPELIGVLAAGGGRH